MIRKFCVVAVSLLTMIGLTACGDNQQAASKSAQEIYDELTEVNDIANPREIDDFAMENEFAVDLELVEEYVGAISNTMSDSALNLVIQAKPGKALEVKTAIENYRVSQQIYFDGYYAEFADALANVTDGRLVNKGDFVILVFANTTGAEYSEIDRVLNELP